MKIWFPVIKGGSGTDVYTSRLSEAVERRGIAAEITWFPSEYQFAPFVLRTIGPPHGTTIIHANSWNAFAFKRAGIPLVVTEHLNVLDPVYGPYKSRAQKFYHEMFIRRFMEASFRKASAITAVSHFTASSLSRTFDINSIQVVPNWIDTKIFSPPEENGSEGNRLFRLLFVGNLSRRKGADLLAPIMRELGSNFELHFTSAGRNRRAWMGTEKNMKNIGQIARESDLVKAYRQCHALLFPSRFEGFGLVALEAMACGRPVIATRSSSLLEVIQDGVTGILCTPDDIGQFVSACRNLAQDRNALIRFGQEGRRRAVNLFSETLIVPRYIDLYKKLAAS